MSLLLLLLLLACEPGASVREQAQAMQRAGEGDFASFDEGLALCARIEAEQTRGECQVRVALAGEPPACDRVQAGTWRDECWFLAAEAAPEEVVAVGRCQRAGAFQEDCCFHLWQDEMRSAAIGVRGEPVSSVLSAGQQRWEALHASQLSPCLREARYWPEYFRAVHEREEPVDLGWCLDLPAEQRAWCTEGLGLVALSRIDRAKPDSFVRTDLCTAWRAGERELALERLGCQGCTELLAERVDGLCP